MSNTTSTDAVKALALDSVNVAKLVSYLLGEPWHLRCEIIPDYMPPFPGKDTRPSVQVRYNDGSEYPSFLRYSNGPKQGFFWDVYGDDMHNTELAIIALSQAPAPRFVGPYVVKLPLHPNL